MMKRGMTEIQIASKIKAGKNFKVSTNRERKMALTAAKYLGVDIITRICSDASGFDVYFPKL